MRPGKVLLLTPTPHVAVEGADEGEMKMDVEKCQLGNLWEPQRVEMSLNPMGWIPGVNKDALFPLVCIMLSCNCLCLLG